MSAFPQIIWRPSQKDVVTEFAPRIILLRATSGATANTVVQVAQPAGLIPLDQVLILRSLTLSGDPGAAQVLQNMSATISQNGTIIHTLVGGSSFPVAVAGLPSFLHWSGELVLTATETLQAVGLFDLGVAGNTMLLSIGGYMVPRGNWQR